MNQQAFDVLTRRTSQFLNRRSALGLLTGTLLAGVLHPAVACKPGHPCGSHDDDHGHGDSGHGHGGHGGDNKHHTKDKQKACAKEAKSYAKLTDGLCIAAFYYDFVLAASCAACFDTCANHLAQCKRGGTSACTEDCGIQWGIPIHYKGKG